MSNRAWVTLATNDSYGLGALVLAHSLRRASSAYPAVVLITPSVTEAMRERLRAVFAEVVVVDVLDSRDAAHLALLQRPELGITFTKIHCWSLTQYEKCVFLDADALVVQNCDELFEREELSAAPDVGWPDCFNSGVFVFRPSAETFSNLVTFAAERGSFDGGDQGLLNSYFSDWAHGDINKHLPFLYNVTSAAFYSYIPALKHYGQNLKIIHFIGAVKPWLQQYNWESRSVEAPEHLREFLQLWWDLFVSQVHSQLDTQMTGVAGNLARVVPGTPLQREAVDELTRRQGWEAGNIDYMGADSFDNIWAKISQTLSQPPEAPSEQAPPPEQQAPQEEAKPEPSEPASVESVKEVEPIVEKESVPEVLAEKPVEAPVEEAKEVPAEVPKPESEVVESAVAPVEAAPSPVEEIEVPVPASEAAEAKPEESIPIPAEAAVEAPAEAVQEKTELAEEVPVAAVEALKIVEPAKPEESAPAPAEVAEPVPQVLESKPEESAKSEASDSPPLANTPSKEETPAAPAAKSEERRKPAGKLLLRPAAADPLPTPDSELEDAATLAHAIIASELRTPTVTSPTPPTLSPSQAAPPSDSRLSVQTPEVPTPPVSLSQIGVKPKASTAAQIESSISKAEPKAETDAPKKKIVKKVVKSKESASGDASTPVPPPRKKEKKPKEK